MELILKRNDTHRVVFHRPVHFQGISELGRGIDKLYRTYSKEGVFLGELFLFHNSSSFLVKEEFRAAPGIVVRWLER